MATTTNPVSGSSNAVLSTDRSGANASAIRYRLAFKQADSAMGLFEELLSLPIFDSTVIDPNATRVSAAVVNPFESNEKSSSADSKNDLNDDEKPSTDDSTDATAGGSVHVAPVQQQTIVDTKTTTTKSEESSIIKTSSESLTETSSVSDRGLEKPTKIGVDKNSSIENAMAGPEVVATSKSDLGINNSSTADTQSKTTQVATQVEPATTEPVDYFSQVVQASSESESDSSKRKRTDETTALITPTEVAFNNAVTGAPTVANEESPYESKQNELPSDSLTNAEAESESEVESTNSRRAEFLSDRRKDSRFEGDSESNSQAKDQQPDAAVDATNKANSTSDLANGNTTNANFELSTSTTFGEGVVSASSGLTQGTSTATSFEQASARASIAASSVSNASANNGASTSTNIAQTISNFGISGASAVPGSTSFSSSSSSSRSTAGSTGLTKYQEQRVLQRALAGIEQLQDGTSPVRIRLHPPELGSLQVTVRVENSQVSAAIEVEHTAAKQVLLENLPKLQASLKDQGITIADFRIEVVPPEEFSGSTTGGFHQQHGQFQDGSSSQTSRYAEIARNRIEQVPVGTASGVSIAAWSRRDGNLDVNV
ncbi:MAG: flagellar hook-length control protein FliK [Planctomycetota bacterium]|nr:flagellar hook-length control protein FliK [Planctomycetota bacterium]